MDQSYDHRIVPPTIAAGAELPEMKGGLTQADSKRHPLAADIDTDQLVSNEGRPSTKIAMERSKSKWRRPLFSKGKGDKHAIDISDIRQGNFGNCYLLASLAALAQSSPKNIENMIFPTIRGDDGGYLVRFHGGTSTFVTYRDIVVLETQRGSVTTLHGDNDECWVLVLEVALRRLENVTPTFGSQDGKPLNNFNGGVPAAVLPLLTGRAAIEITAAKFDGAQMQEHLRTGRALVASSGGTRWDNLWTTELCKKYGLAVDPESKQNVSHAYAVTKVEKRGDGEYYVSLFNPWGQEFNPRPIPIADFKKLFFDLAVG